MSDGGLKVVDAYDLDDELRIILQPGERMRDKHGRQHRLPRYFYEIESEQQARDTYLTSNFCVFEFLQVDLKEHERMQRYPRYIPCAVRPLAFYLQRLRDSVGSVHIAVNGGYRSPAHRLAEAATPHMWGTAADVFRIGSAYLLDQETIEKYVRIAEDIAEELWAMPYGHEPGMADDHLHLDLGYLSYIPREVSEDRMKGAQAEPRVVIEERRGRDRRAERREEGA